MKDLKGGKSLVDLSDFYAEVVTIAEPFSIQELRSRLVIKGWDFVFTVNVKRAINKLIDAGFVTREKHRDAETYFAVQYLPKDLELVTLSNLRLSPFTAGVIELTKDGEIKNFSKDKSKYFRAMVLHHSRFLASIGVFRETNGEFEYVNDLPLRDAKLLDSAPFLPISRVYDERWKDIKKIEKAKKTKSDTELDRFWAERSTKDIIELNRMMLHQIPCPLE